MQECGHPDRLTLQRWRTRQLQEVLDDADEARHFAPDQRAQVAELLLPCGGRELPL